MKQRDIGDRFSLVLGGRDSIHGKSATGRKKGFRALGRVLRRSLRRTRLESGDQLGEPQLLQPLADGLQLPGGELDQALALGAQLERLAQARLVRVEPPGDLPE